MELRFYLDGTLYDDPLEYEDLSITLERDNIIKGLIIKYTNKFKFTGAAYEYLQTQKTDNGFCVLVDTEIQYLNNGNWTELFSGTINISDIKFSKFKRYAEVAVEDSGWTTLINSNKSVKTRVQLSKSKNGVTITPVTVENIDFYDSLTGNYDYADKDSYKVDECFRFIIAFITDDEVDYESPLFGTGGDYEHLYLTTCQALNGYINLGNILEITFADLFTEINKRVNISFYMDYSGTKPKIVIDKTDNLYSDTISETIDDPEEIEETFTKGELYSLVKLGGQNITNDGSDANANFPEKPFIGFRKEEYNILGQCNVDVTQDLEQRWVSDHNIIHVCVKDLVTQYDGSIVVFEANPADMTKARQYDTFNVGTAPYYYNLGLTNQAVANNYLGYLPSSMASFLTDNIETFTAGLTADLLIPTGVILWDKDTAPEGEDLGGNYDTATGRYSAASSGNFSLHTNFKFYFDASVLVGVAPGTELVRLYFRRYSSADVLLDEAQLPSIYNTTPAITGYAFTVSIFKDTTDYFTMEAEADYAAVYIDRDAYEGYSHFECTSTPDDGGVYMDYDSLDYRIVNYSFRYPLELSRMLNIINNSDQRVNFTLYNETFGGHIKKAEFLLRKSLANIILITNIRNQ